MSSGTEETKKKLDTFLAVLTQQKVCNVLLHTDPPNTPSPSRTEFLCCGVQTAKSLEVVRLSCNKKLKPERDFLRSGREF